MLTYCGDHFVIHKNNESLCCTPETNVSCQLYLNKKEIKRKWKLIPIPPLKVGIVFTGIDGIQAKGIACTQKTLSAQLRERTKGS